jgi:hypothetical protein
MDAPSSSHRDTANSERVRDAETALRRLGYAKIPPVVRDAPVEPEFWVQEAGVPRRTYPVFLGEGNTRRALDRLDAWVQEAKSPRASPRRAIVVVGSDRAAEEAWARVRRVSAGVLEPEFSFLVLPSASTSEASAHWHAVVVEPRELLRLTTGVVVGLFARAQAQEGSSQIDFEEMLEILRTRFRIDVRASLGVESDEDALFMLYHLALRDSYAPGDPGANLHMLVLKPTGPAARLPWFAA